MGFGEGTAADEDAHYASSAAKFFRPEFVNRLDRVVAFRSLERQHVGALVQRLVERLLARRGLRRSGILVRVDEAVVDYIVDEGFDPAFGARALARTLEVRLTVPLAAELVRRHLAGRAHVDVFPVGDALTLAVRPLQDSPTVRPLPTAPDDLDGLRRLHGDLTAGVVALKGGTTWRMAADARAELLAALADGDRQATTLDRLHFLAQLAEECAALAESLEELEAHELAAFSFEDTIEVDVYEERPHRWWDHPRRVREVSAQVPVPVDRRQARAALKGRLGEAIVHLAALEHRLAHVDAPPDPVLVRILPETPDSRALVARLTRALVDAWSSWGRVQVWGRSKGWRRILDDAEVEGAGAVELHAPGIRSLIEPVAGFVLEVRTLGPDTLARLCRLEVFPPSPDPPGQQLQAADDAWDAWRAARRRGQPVGSSPRGLLPVVLTNDGTAPLDVQIRSICLATLADPEA